MRRHPKATSVESTSRKSSRVVLWVLTAAFLLIPTAHAAAATLEVNLAGEGTGHVQATLLHENEEPFGEINCSNVPGHTPAEDVCSATVQAGDRSSDLKATGGPLSVFTGWETTGLFGGCKGLTNPCSFIVLFGDATVTANFGSEELAPKVEFPAAPLEPVQGITGSEAEFHGRVNPEGDLLKACRFEYLTQAAYEKDGNSFKAAKQLPCVPTPAGIGEGSSPVEVQAKATGLEPNAEYRVRLLAEKEKSDPKAVTGETTFTTDPAAPTLSDSNAWSVSDSAATLAATVNPRNSEVADCHFEWGLTIAYGQSVPCDPKPGSGNEDVQVIAALAALSPSTAYHFRLIADNGVGGPQPGTDATFTTRAPAVFPERSYELVSPFAVNGIPAFPDLAAADGNRYAYSSGGLPLPGSLVSSGGRFVATRNPADGSWTQQYVGPPSPPAGSSGQPIPRPAFSPGLSHIAWGTVTGIDPDDQNKPVGDDDRGQDYYLRNLDDGSFTWLSRDPRIPAGAPQTDPTNVSLEVSAEYAPSPNISADGRRAYFTSRRNLLDADITTSSIPAVYEWHDGQLDLVSVEPGLSTGFNQGASIGSPGRTGTNNPWVYGNAVSRNAVSPDGRRIVIQVGDELDVSGALGGSRRLYVRVGGDSTVEASASAPGAPLVANPKQVYYGGADKETNSVFFMSSSPLTADSSAPDTAGTIYSPSSSDLYRYNVPPDGDPAHGELVDLTVDSGGAGVTQVLWVSDDGRRVYFTASDALTPDATFASKCHQILPNLAPKPGGVGPTAPGPCNVYLAQLDGPADDTAQLTLVATAQVLLQTQPGGTSEKQRAVSSNPDGSILAFSSYDQLVPGRRAGPPGTYQVYVYESARDELSCASCPRDGSATAASGDLTPGGDSIFDLFATTNKYVPHIRNVSSDGAVFFQTEASLLPADAKGGKSVYEWRDGSLNLITSGDDPGNAFFADASEGDSAAPGATVFFQSSGAYVHGVVGGIPRIYAARVGGGFTPPLPNPPCTGEDCKPVATPQPNYAAPSTSTVIGRGNVVEPPKARRCGKGKRKVRRQGKDRCVRQSRHSDKRHLRSGANRKADR